MRFTVHNRFELLIPNNLRVYAIDAAVEGIGIAWPDVHGQFPTD